jgi:hypothetical protein
MYIISQCFIPSAHLQFSHQDKFTDGPVQLGYLLYLSVPTFYAIMWFLYSNIRQNLGILDTIAICPPGDIR